MHIQAGVYLVGDVLPTTLRRDRPTARPSPSLAVPQALSVQAGDKPDGVTSADRDEAELLAPSKRTEIQRNMLAQVTFGPRYADDAIDRAVHHAPAADDGVDVVLIAAVIKQQQQLKKAACPDMFLSNVHIE